MLNEKDLINPNERKYLITAVIASLLTYVLLIVSISGIFFIMFFLVLSLFAHGIMLAFIRTNGVKLSSTQFPAVFEKTKGLCEKMGMATMPDVYVVQSGGVLTHIHHPPKFYGYLLVFL